MRKKKRACHAARTSPEHSRRRMMCTDAQHPMGPGKARRFPNRARPTSFAKSSRQRCCRPLRSSFLSQPVHGERKAFACCGSGLSWHRHPSNQASCISLVQRIQGNVAAQGHNSKFPILQEERETFSPDQFCPTTFKSDEGRSLSDHGSPSLPSPGFSGNRVSTCFPQQETDNRFIQIHLMLPPPGAVATG